MNSQTKRFRTFYLLKKFTVVEKFFITTKGFYFDDNQLICYKCAISIGIDRNSMDEVRSHECGNRRNLSQNVVIPSPYNEPPGAVIVQNDLNYEEFRYATFKKWCMAPKVTANRLELASAGFYCAINLQTIKCFYCKTIVNKMQTANRMIALHKSNKKCQQKQFSLQIRVNNLSRDYFLSRISRIKRNTLPTTINTEQAGPSRMLAIYNSPTIGQPGPSRILAIRDSPTIEQGPSGILAICDSPTIDSPVASGPLQRAFEEFLRDPKKKSIYTKALNLGLDQHLVNTIVKRRLQFECTFENIEELIEFCFTFHANRNLAQKISREIEKEIECKICMNEKVGVVFKPCHHVVACAECGQKVSACPICCHKIDECHRIYF